MNLLEDEALLQKNQKKTKKKKLSINDKKKLKKAQLNTWSSYNW